MEVVSTLRLPEELDEKVKEEARAERRSKNQQLIRILEERYGVSAEQPKSANKHAELATA